MFSTFRDYMEMAVKELAEKIDSVDKRSKQ
jgi:hypothetical protein